MAQVSVSLGGRAMPVACRDGEEARVAELGRALERRWPDALRAAGGVSVERALFVLAMMLADELDEAERRPLADGAVSEAVVAHIAERLERLAEALEQAPANA